MLSKKELKQKYGESKILVVPFERLADVKDGFEPLKHNRRYWSVFDNSVIAVKRYDAEGSPEFQQVIPYIIITNEDETKFFVTQRINGESRLKNMFSIGIGGHMDDEDGREDVLFKTAYRELMEEVNAEFVGALNIIGTVRDMKSNTNDHFGVVMKVRSNDSFGVSVKETNILKGEWFSKEGLINKYESFEGWSKIIINEIIK